MQFPWNRKETELKRELAHHLYQLTAEFERQGHSHDAAERMARREFGGAEQVKERCRDERRWAWMAGIRQDLVFAVRQTRRSPGFAATAVITLALGIAANVIVFGVMQTMVLRSLDVPRGERVMTLSLATSEFPFIAYPAVRAVRDGSTVFSSVAAYAMQNFGLEFDGATRPLWGLEVGGQYFEVAGIRPFLGRLLNRADDAHAGASEAAVLSWPAWKSEFGGDPKVIGKTVRVNRQPYTIVGVTPEGFYGTEKFLQPAIFVPLANQAALEGVGWLERRDYREAFAVVRLKDGVTLPQAQAELDAIAARVRQQYPVEEERLRFKLAQPGLVGDTLGKPARAFLTGVMVLAGIVLLAACVNLGSLFAARTADRTREIAIRMAIGSSRWRVIRQLLVEAFYIALAGGACACALAWAALRGLANWHPVTDYPVHFTVMPQASLLGIAFLITVGAGVVFGLMPLRQIFKTDANEAIKGGGFQTFRGRRWALRDVLLAAQIALCCVTVTAAFFSLRGLGRTLTMDLGFQPRNAILTRFELRQAGYSSEAADRFQQQLLERISALPGVERAGYSNTTPLKGDHYGVDIYAAEASDLRPSAKAFDADAFLISPGYLAAAGTTLLAGRDVSFADNSKAPGVALVNREFARRLRPSGDAIGRHFKTRTGQPVQIIGVVGDGKYVSLSENQKAAVFYPITQRPSTSAALLVRTRSDTAQMVSTIRKVLREMDPAIPIRESSEWTTQLAMSFLPTQAATVALGMFGAFGLLLSIAGTFGLASYTVSRRLRELSLRVALGAAARQVVATALGRLMFLLACGSIAGMVLGMAASRMLAAIVYQASAQDPMVVGGVAATMVLTGALSVASPVRRALRIDPAKLLREQ